MTRVMKLNVKDMETEIENLVNACRQVVHWADAPTLKGEFPQSFINQLNNAIENIKTNDKHDPKNTSLDVSRD